MNQEKIGRFISNLRKEQGITQQQLADTIGVSNKTISKWECGKGMPEISSVMPLCQTLQINVNELLSGERLPEEGYSEKAEENMMKLIKEAENSKKKSGNSVSVIIVTLMAVVLGMSFTVITNMGVSNGVALLDYSTMLPMLFITVLFLLGTKLGKPFLQAFVIVVGKKKDVSETDVMQAKAAVGLVSNTLLGVGALESIIGFIAIMLYNIGTPLSEGTPALGAGLYIVSLSILYGLIGYLLLLPIRTRLQILENTFGR